MGIGVGFIHHKAEGTIFIAQKLKMLLADLKEPEALACVEKALEEGTDPFDLLAAARVGMNIVGQRFADADYFIPDLVF